LTASVDGGARVLIVTGQGRAFCVDAPEALSYGLLTSVHSAAELMPAAMELARRFRFPGARAVAQSKMAVRMCGDADLASAKNIGLEALTMLIGAPEWQEGMAAFMEKRPPNFPPLR
jgi:enoyl-CoA hydratase